MRYAGVLLSLLVQACRPDLGVPEGISVTCRTDADCPPPLECSRGLGECVALADDTRPRLVAAVATSPLTVTATFSEPVTPASAQAVAAYVITPSLAIHSARLLDAVSVELSTDAQTADAPYELSAQGVVDLVGNSTAEAPSSFSGFGDAFDARPPEPLAPADGAVVTGLAATLRWSERLGAADYTIEVATDAEFAAPLAGSPFTTTATSLDVVLVEPVAYHWRVRADVTTPGEFGAASFDAVDDTVFVYCPSTSADDCQSRDVETGSRTHPFARPSQALQLLVERGLQAIHVAARGGGVPYADLLHLEGTGAEILGGFDAGFSTRDPEQHVTVLRSWGIGLEVSNNPTPVHIDGLTIESRAPLNPVAMRITGAAAEVHLTNLVLDARAPVGETSSLRVLAGPGPVLLEDSRLESHGADLTSAALYVEGGVVTLRRCDIETSAGQSSAGVVVSHAEVPVVLEDCGVSATSEESATAVTLNPSAILPGATPRADIRGCVLRAEGGTYATGLSVLRARDSTIEGNAISAEGGWSATGVTLNRARAVQLVNNLVTTGGADGDAMTVSLSPPEWLPGDAVVVAYNTVVLGPSPFYARALLLSATPTSFVGNLFASLSTDNACVVEGLIEVDGSSHPAAFVANALVGCTGYTSASGGSLSDGASIDAEDGEAAALSGGQGARFSGNVVGSQALAEIFVDVDGVDDDFTTMDDNDLRLLLATDPDGLAGAGGDPATLDCGTHDAGASCPAPLDDLLGTTRDVPLSAGAFEAP